MLTQPPQRYNSIIRRLTEPERAEIKQSAITAARCALQEALDSEPPTEIIEHVQVRQGTPEWETAESQISVIEGLTVITNRAK